MSTIRNSLLVAPGLFNKFQESPLTKLPTVGKDTFGYYTVDDFKTYSKLEAIEQSKAKKRPFFWNFNQYETDNHVWDVEPKDTLDELYRQRAQEIRDKYDYVVLMFSGGRDSGNIFHAFTSNNIKLDEIVTYKYDGGVEDQITDFKDTANVPKRLKEAEDAGYPYKITQRHIDLSKIVAQYGLFGKFQLLNRGYLQNHHYSISHYAKSYIREYVPEYRQIINSSKKMCIIWGCDKPLIARWKDVDNTYQFGAFYADYSLDATVPLNSQLRGIEAEHDEMFYWGNTTTAMNIVSKQCYTVARFFNTVGLAGILDMRPELISFRMANKYKLLDDNPITPEHWEKLRQVPVPYFTNYRDISDWLIYPTSFDITKHSAYGKIGQSAIDIDGQQVVYLNKFASLRDVRWQNDQDTQYHFKILKQQLDEHREFWRDPSAHFVANSWRWNTSKVYRLGNI